MHDVLLGGSFYEKKITSSITCRNDQADPMSFRVDDSLVPTPHNDCVYLRTCGTVSYEFFQDSTGNTAGPPVGITDLDLHQINAARFTIDTSNP